MEYETIRVIQGYAYWAMTIVFCLALYWYIFRLYRRQKSGVEDYEKYARLALDDDLNDCLIDKRNNKKES